MLFDRAAMQTTMQQQPPPQQPGPDDPHIHQPGMPPPLPGTDGRPVRASYELQLKVQALMTMMTDEEKIEFGHSVDDLIVDCEFAGTTCSSSYVNYMEITLAKNTLERDKYAF